MVKTPLDLWISNREEAIKKFFEELQNVDAPAYLEIPLNPEEWKTETDPVKKMAVVVLLTAWLNDKDLSKIWEGWYYKQGDFLIMIEPNGSYCTVAIINKSNGQAFVETYSIPQELEPLFLIDTQGVFDEA